MGTVATVCQCGECQGCREGREDFGPLDAVANRLRRLGYSAEATANALVVIGRTGTVWCCAGIADGDLAEIEAVIPGAGARFWPPWTDRRVELGRKAGKRRQIA